MLRFAPAITLGVLCLPVLCGLAGTILPAFGYLPALGGHELHLGHFHALFSKPGIFTSTFLALITGLVSTFLSLLLVGLFVAGWIGTPIFARIQHLVSPLLAVPHAAAAFGLAFLIAPSGFLARLFSPWLTGWDRPPDWLIVNDPWAISLILGLVVKETPFLLLVTLAALPQVPVLRARQLSASLGYGRMIGFVHTLWPALYKQIRLAIFAVIAYATSVVDVSIILGPSIPSPLPVRLVEWMNDPDLSQRFLASAGACLQIGVTLSALAFWFLIEKIGFRLRHQFLALGLRFRRDQALRMSGLILMAFSALVVFGGLIVMSLWSVAGLWNFPDILPKTLSIRNWNNVLPQLGVPLWTSINIGLAATAISLILVLACLRREQQTGRNGGQRALLMLYIPLLVPQIGFLFGLQLMLIAANADASWLALVFVHIVFVLPYVFLSLSAPWRSFDARYEAIGTALGASSSRVFWRIRLPMLLRAIAAAAAIGFAVSIGQYLPTLLIGAGRFATITTEAVALGTGGNRRVIAIYGFLQMALPFLGFLLATSVPALLFRNRQAINGT